MVELNKNLKASTLLESLISMVLIMICFTIATAVYLNIIRGNQTGKKLKVHLLMEKMAFETKQNNTYLDETQNYENMVIRKMIKPYPSASGLYLLSLKAFENEKLFDEYNELIRDTEK